MDTSGVTYVKETVLSHPDIHSVPHITVWTSQGSGRRLDCVAFWGGHSDWDVGTPGLSLRYRQL